MGVKTFSSTESYSGDKTFEGFDMSAPEVGSVELYMTGNPSGDVTLEVTNFNGKVEDIPEDRWNVVAGSSQAIAAQGSIFYDLRAVGAKWYRLKFDGSGTGTGNIEAIGKGD